MLAAPRAPHAARPPRAFGAAGLSLFALAALFAIGGAACSSNDGSPNDTLADEGSDLIGGVDAPEVAFEAIGAIGSIPASGAFKPFCTGVLIGPKAVLTAKHCAVDMANPSVLKLGAASNGSLAFAIGSNAEDARRVVGISSVMLSPVKEGGFFTSLGGAALGSDVAIYLLADPIEDVVPFRVSASSLGPDDEGKVFTAVGYGMQSQARRKYGVRQKGSMTLRATSGSPMARMFGTSDAFFAFVADLEGEGYVDQWKDGLDKTYAYELLRDYEVWAGLGQNDSQLCNGDSGGPLLVERAGSFEIVGIASGVVVGTKAPCSLGGAYAAFGPRVREMIDDALRDPCAGVPLGGRCEGDAVLKCSDPDVLPRTLRTSNCRTNSSTCAASEDGLSAACR